LPVLGEAARIKANTETDEEQEQEVDRIYIVNAVEHVSSDGCPVMPVYFRGEIEMQKECVHISRSSFLLRSEETGLLHMRSSYDSDKETREQLY
jgi:hypothetical protein